MASTNGNIPGTNVKAPGANVKTNARAPGEKSVFVDSLKDSWLIILIVVAMFIIVLIVIYIVSMVKKNKLQNVSLQQSMIGLNDRNVVPYKVDASQMSLVNNGQEFSYCFWVILNSTYDSTTDHKLVFQRGNTPVTAGGQTKYSSNTNPIVLLDKTTNKMYVCVSTSQVSSPSMTATEILHTNSLNQFDSGFMVSVIDYVPLQRWVFVGVVIRDTTLYVFLDGDLYSATTVYDVGTNSKVRPMIRGTNGDLIFGEKMNTTQGYISNTKFFNYALTQKEMQSTYNAGPVKTSLLGMLGINNYGVRSPIYEIQQ